MNELNEILLSDDIVNSIINNFNKLIKIVPEIEYMVAFDQKHPHHHLDLFMHTVYALAISENNIDVRLTLLLHDIGKPFCYQEGDIRHFYGHSKYSSDMSREILTRLNYPMEYIDKIAKLIKLHDTPITENNILENPIFYNLLYKVQYCDCYAHHPDKLAKRIDYLNKTKKKLNNIAGT